jgi:hypothetical protein
MAMRGARISWLAVLAAVLAAGSANAQKATLGVAVQNGQFSPQELHAPAGAPATLRITNLDTTPAEFSSSTLGVDRMITSNTSVVVTIRALPRGRYTFFDLAHTGAHGVLILD